MHISKRDAEAEALRIATEFVASNLPTDSPYDWEILPVRPDVLTPGYKRRKTVIKWSAAVRLSLKRGVIVAGGPIVLVDIETKEAKWADG